MATSRKNQTFSDHIDRLFPADKTNTLKVNGDHVRTITFQVTESCNLRCKYCYQHDKSRQNKMTFDVGKRFIDMILASDDRSNKYITSTQSRGCILDFIGGEPFLEIDLIDQLTDYFLEQAMLLHHPWATRYRISISTNGTLYFDPRVQAYIKKHSENLSLGITIDGNKELHDACRVDVAGNGTYDQVIKAVQHYRDNYGGMSASKMTIAPGNVDKLCDAVKSMIDIGYTSINLNCVYENVWSIEHARILYHQLKELSDYLIKRDLAEKIFISMLKSDWVGKPMSPDDNKNFCGGTGLMIGVDYKGDIYPCLRYMDNAICGKQEPYIIGNIYDGIMSAKEQCDRVQCMSCITRRSQSTDECFNCPIATGCSWCSGYNYEIFGTPNKRATFICDMHKARVLAISYLWNNWYNKKHIKERHKLYIPDEWAISIIGEEELEYLKDLAKE